LPLPVAPREDGQQSIHVLRFVVSDETPARNPRDETPARNPRGPRLSRQASMRPARWHTHYSSVSLVRRVLGAAHGTRRRAAASCMHAWTPLTRIFPAVGDRWESPRPIRVRPRTHRPPAPPSGSPRGHIWAAPRAAFMMRPRGLHAPPSMRLLGSTAPAHSSGSQARY